MAIRLYLVPGDRVRNIRIHSNRKGWCGTVHAFDHCRVLVKYDNGTEQTYLKTQAHISLVKIESACPCSQHVLKLDYSKLEERILANPHLWKDQFSGTPSHILNSIDSTLGVWKVQMVHDETQYTIRSEPIRRVLKKVRRNVLTGKTQEQTIAELGAARGVQQFNTRALGTTTGQVFHAIGCAMTNPGTPIRIANVDHAKDQPGCSTSWTSLNKHFRSVLIKHLGDMKGFTLDETHITFNPIVTEETYVEVSQ